MLMFVSSGKDFIQDLLNPWHGECLTETKQSEENIMNTGIDAVALMGRIDNLGESLKKAIGEFRYADALRISSERMSLIKTFSEVAPKTAEFMPALRSFVSRTMSSSSEIVRSAGRLEATAGRAA